MLIFPYNNLYDNLGNFILFFVGLFTISCLSIIDLYYNIEQTLSLGPKLG